jgi:response regulator RpfG family c-di-GMP phosphodiesterase
MEAPVDTTEEKARYGVLFVDDEPHILSALKRLVLEEELDVHLANSGAQGLEMLKQEEEIGLIISDQRMPGMSGAEFLAKAKEVKPDALRIILTGYADIDATIDAINRGGAHRYLSKPWNDDTLLETIRESLRYYALARENQRLSEIVRKQNEELKNWNGRLKGKVLQQTAMIREKNELLQHHVLRLKQTFKGTLTAFTSLLELRDRSVRNHSKNVTQVATEIAIAMGLPPKECDLIQIAAKLHDIGKIGIPDALMGTPEESMNAEELTEYMRHSIRGQAAIDAIDELRPAGVLIRHHLEHYNGSGYPDRLAGEAIPLGAQILAIADFFDSQIQKQQGDNPVDKVLELVKQQMGSRFDPTLLPHVEQPVRAYYEKLFTATGLSEQKISLHALREGMILTDDLYSGTGLLLLSKGTSLTRVSIEAIMRNNELDPLPNEIIVMIRQ